MKTSQAKIKRLRAMYSALCDLEKALFDAYTTAVAELDRTLMLMERDLEKAQKGELR